MLTQQEANDLIALVKVLGQDKAIKFPEPGHYLTLDANDYDSTKISFLIDVQRKSIKITKCTYQMRFRSHVLVRLDIDGPDHMNPDGTIVPCPHIHLYREGFETRLAFPLRIEQFPAPTDLAQVLSDFLAYNNVIDRPIILDSGGGLL